jgi:hypothetical protein
VRILVFLHGTTIMHASGVGRTLEERLRQVRDREASVRDFTSYVPIGDAVAKLALWCGQGAEIVYLSSHRSQSDIANDESVLHRFEFPPGHIVARAKGEDYGDVAAQVEPDVIVEDDCESIGGTVEMTLPQLRPELRESIASIVVGEFEGIDHLPDDISALPASH